MPARPQRRALTGKPGGRVPERRLSSYLHKSKIRPRNLDTRSNHAWKSPSRLRFVPLEGHWERVNTPVRKLSERERRLVWIVGALVATAAIAAVVVAIVTSGSSDTGPASGSSNAGCVEVEVPGTMGAGVNRVCGDQAVTFCRDGAPSMGPLRNVALQKCREQGYATPSD